MPYTKFEDTYGSNQPPITDLRLDFIENGVESAIEAVEDGTSFGVELADLDATTLDRSEWGDGTFFADDTNFLLVVQDGVAKKLPLEQLRSLNFFAAENISLDDTPFTWYEGVAQIICNHESAPNTITLPKLVNGLTEAHPPTTILNIGTQVTTLVAASGVTINRVSGKPLTIPPKGVAYVNPYFAIPDVATVYLAWGDLA